MKKLSIADTLRACIALSAQLLNCRSYLIHRFNSVTLQSLQSLKSSNVLKPVDSARYLGSLVKKSGESVKTQKFDSLKNSLWLRRLLVDSADIQETNTAGTRCENPR